MANLITGSRVILSVIMLFFPLIVTAVDIRFPEVAVCMVASFAAIQEGHFIRTGK